MLGSVELVAADAGRQGELAQVTELSVEQWRQTVEVNLASAFLTLKTLLPPMIQRGRGAMVTIASIASTAGPPGKLLESWGGGADTTRRSRLPTGSVRPEEDAGFVPRRDGGGRLRCYRAVGIRHPGENGWTTCWSCRA